jgi:hypothetical protein
MSTATYAAPLGSPRFRGIVGSTVLNGGKAYVYQAGTTTLDASYPTYADALAGTNANANPVILDSNGEAAIYLQSGRLYKVKLTDSLDVLQWTMDSLNPAYGYPSSLDTRTAFCAIKSSNQTGFATATKITGWTVQKDTASEWSAASSRWVAAASGLYLVAATAALSDTVASQSVELDVEKNGSLVVGSTISRTAATGGQTTTPGAHHLLDLVAGDYLELFLVGTVNTTVYQSSATALTIVRVQ